MVPRVGMCAAQMGSNQKTHSEALKIKGNMASHKAKVSEAIHCLTWWLCQAG